MDRTDERSCDGSCGLHLHEAQPVDLLAAQLLHLVPSKFAMPLGQAARSRRRSRLGRWLR
jgi:hypothetical protein